MRTLVVVNPRSGGIADPSDVVATIRRHDAMGDPEIRIARSPGDAAVLAGEGREEGFDRIFAVGGDGTMNEVLNGVGPGEGPVLGFLPQGTGNDFARTLGLPRDLEGALDLVADAVARPADVVEVSGSGGDRLFLNASAGGFSGRVDDQVTQERKKSWGPLAYLRSAIDLLPDPETYHATLALDGEESRELEVLNVLVANGRTVAGGIPMAPEARVDDGVLDVIVVRAAPLAELAGLASLCLLGKHLAHELVLALRSSRVTLDARPEMSFNLDGERLDATPLEYRVLPRAVRVLVDPAAERAFTNGA